MSNKEEIVTDFDDSVIARVEGSPNASHYGSYFWTVTTFHDGRRSDVSLFADRVEVTAIGVLTFWQDKEKAVPVMGFAPGQWQQFYASSMIDGRPVAVDHHLILKKKSS